MIFLMQVLNRLIEKVQNDSSKVIYSKQGTQPCNSINNDGGQQVHIINQREHHENVASLLNLIAILPPISISWVRE